MLVKRVAMGLLVVAALAVDLVAMPPAAQGAYHRSPDGPKATVSTGATGGCVATSRSGHRQDYLCGTGYLYITWTQNGDVIAHDDVVIGRDYRVYDDPGTGFRWLRGGVAGGPVPVGLFGHGDVTSVVITMIGTDDYGYCDTTVAPGTWTGWTRCA